MQNFGGKIFEELPYLPEYFAEETNRNYFLGVHRQNISAIASAFGISSQRRTSSFEVKAAPGVRCLEFMVDSQQESAFKQHVKALKTRFLSS